MDLLKNAGDILRTVVPILGIAIGGPLGGIAASKISEILLGKPDGNSEEISKAIMNASSEQLVKLKQVENDFKVQMKSLDIDIEKIAADDRNSARLREMAVKDWVPKFIAFTTILSFFSYIGMVTFFPFEHKPNMEFINLAIGWIGGVASSVVSYYFGSSSGSAEKNKIIANFENNKL